MLEDPRLDDLSSGRTTPTFCKWADSIIATNAGPPATSDCPLLPHHDVSSRIGTSSMVCRGASPSRRSSCRPQPTIHHTTPTSLPSTQIFRRLWMTHRLSNVASPDHRRSLLFCQPQPGSVTARSQRNGRGRSVASRVQANRPPPSLWTRHSELASRLAVSNPCRRPVSRRNRRRRYFEEAPLSAVALVRLQRW
jgi:hypothetical protein